MRINREVQAIAESIKPKRIKSRGRAAIYDDCTVCIDKSAIVILDQIAAEEGVSRSFVIRQAITEYLERMGRGKNET